jgi:4-alpha-glucanotransferase
MERGVMKRRRSGVMIPLFSLTSSQSWGIGEYRDLAMFARWLRQAGQAFVQILPITELPEAETSPYSAMTAMAIDPIYIAVPAVDDFVAIGGESQLSPEDQATLARLRDSSRVQHQDVRALKGKWLRRAYEHFAHTDLAHNSRRAQAFYAFVTEQAAWIEDYALFRALRHQHSQLPWWDWPQPLVTRDPRTLDEARARLKDEILYRQYLQWIAAEQWQAARDAAAPVEIFGDVPFMISADSPDVWRRQEEFRFDATVGVPPDAFSETGQDWGLPPWRWEVMARTDFAWMRTRAERTAALFHGFRLDHLVGLYRTYNRPRAKEAKKFFTPANEDEQLKLGEQLVSLYTSTGAEVIAEDLGTVPDFVRASLQRLGVPGFKVMRWERRWKEPGEPYIDPGDYAPVSVATTGTHDTEPLVTWWESLDDKERAEALAIPSVQRHVNDSASEMDAVLRGLLDAASYLTILPLQDVFGWPDRINTPAQISDENWRWLLPWRVDELSNIPEARTRAAELAGWTRAAGRSD